MKTFIAAAIGVFVAGLIAFSPMIIENVDSGKTVVIQDFFDGDLTVYQTPGVKMQLFGKVTEYDQSNQYWFEEAAADGTDTDDGAKRRGCFNLRFNDQGTAKLCGSATFDFPTDDEQILALHSKYKSQNGVVERLIKPALSRAVYHTGPLMSSRESAGERRSDLTAFVLGQANVGVYKVASTPTTVPDEAADPIKTTVGVSEPVVDAEGAVVLNEEGNPKMHIVQKVVFTTATKTIKVTEPVMNNGIHVLQEPSALAAFGLRLHNLTITGVKYDDRVNKQIQAQQAALMSIQTARAQSTKAVQDALTAKAKGEAKEATTRAAEAVKTVQATAEAERKVVVAEQSLRQAKLLAEAVVAKATADAKAKELLADADGSLTQKLAAFVQSQKYWAAAAAKQPQVPGIIIGATGGSQGGSTSTLQDLMTLSLTKQLGLDMGIKRGKTK